MSGPCISFGKHKGKPLADLPTGYLRWVLANCPGADPWLLASARKEAERRGERFLPAAEVLADLEEQMAVELDNADVDHDTAAVLGDVVLTAFEAVRQKCGLGTETELHVPPREPARMAADDL
jgi:hypothetical protein